MIPLTMRVFSHKFLLKSFFIILLFAANSMNYETLKLILCLSSLMLCYVNGDILRHKFTKTEEFGC